MTGMNPGTLKGTLYLAGSTDYQPVSVALNDDQLIISLATSNDVITASRDELKVASKVASLPREVVLPDKNLLSIDSHEGLDSWLDESGSGRLAKLEKSRGWIIASVLLSPVLLYAIFKFVVPSLAITFADYVPDSLTSITSSHTLEVMDRAVLDPSQLAADTYDLLQGEFAPVLARYNRPGRNYKVLFRQSDVMGANAFALPDGTIVFTDDIVELMDANPRELKAILLHEIGHVEQQHSMRLIAESLATTLVITYFFGDVSGLVELFMGVSGTVVQNQYSQRLEAEADDFALAQAHFHGLTPDAFADAMSTLAESVPPDAQSDRFFSSHPLLQERIQKAREAAGKE